ncbi:MAG: glutamate 5-kinase [Verrucomicrobiales bacterium]|jgi:glutamate 5-kinase|nr:glutamate 5-kinase [Verrucomicrobiales bacterium]MDP6678930.1 glutamate 5-kinase [Verrucomicrobiota bacterium]MDP7013079.1 glutamate 5-kinase [Verrucomicrobiota bacterium]
MDRASLKETSRLVVKLGTGILTSRSKQIDPGQVEQLVAQVAAQRSAGREVIIVSSGAVGAGMGALGLAKRPTDLSDLQACAAVGQSRLMSTYSELFARHDLPVAQVLLTHDDLEHRDRHLNARNTLVSLLDKGVVPIVNENDAVSYTELKFGDNDWLAALVACLLPADLLVVLTTVDGLVENFGKKNPRTLPVVETIDANIRKLAGGTLSATAVGGMEAKLRAAGMTARTGIPMVIASGKKKRVLANIIGGRDEGTFFTPRPGRLKGHKRRIAFFHHPKGSLWVDNGARDALREKGKSLLPPGVARCNGDFAKGDVVRICDLNGTEFSRGISRFDADEIRTRTLKGIEIVHRNDLVIL